MQSELGVFTRTGICSRVTSVAIADMASLGPHMLRLPRLRVRDKLLQVREDMFLVPCASFIDTWSLPSICGEIEVSWSQLLRIPPSAAGLLVHAKTEASNHLAFLQDCPEAAELLGIQERLVGSAASPGKDLSSPQNLEICSVL